MPKRKHNQSNEDIKTENVKSSQSHSQKRSKSTRSQKAKARKKKSSKPASNKKTSHDHDTKDDIKLPRRPKLFDLLYEAQYHKIKINHRCGAPLAPLPVPSLLADRYKTFYSKSCRFAKWRAALKIGNGMPSELTIKKTTWTLSRYGSICQGNGLVPIIEPEILQDGKHSIEACATVSERVFSDVMKAMLDQLLIIEGCMLKPNMITQGSECSKIATPAEVAWYTIRTLSRTIVPALPTVCYLSGGSSEENASLFLNAMNVKENEHPKPWSLTFSYGRALQKSVLDAWKGKEVILLLLKQFFSKVVCQWCSI